MSPTSSAVSRRSASGTVAALWAVATVVLAVGCTTSSHGSPSAHGTSSSHGTPSQHTSSPAGGAGSLSASQALALASRNASKVSSLTLKESAVLHGLPATAGIGSARALKLIMDERLRLKPTVAAELSMHINVAGKALALQEILTSRALYLRAPGIAPASPGKPWAKISLSALPNGMNLRRLFSQTQNNGPFSQLGSPQALAKLLGAAKNVRVVRNQVVNGVSTTEYSGVISSRSILALMPAADRKLFGSLPSGLRFGGPFRVWIDGQHFMRRVELRFSFRKVSIAVRVDVTSINQPVTIVPPPASQVSAAGQ
jgi:hypothetical protein